MPAHLAGPGNPDIAEAGYEDTAGFAAQFERFRSINQIATRIGGTLLNPPVQPNPLVALGRQVVAADIPLLPFGGGKLTNTESQALISIDDQARKDVVFTAYLDWCVN